jgi:CO/xanthine dehydrogenase Mo-binding subunit
MAKRRGRGFATIEYPTGMNQNGDPTQAWIKLKPDGSVDVFAGTVDIGQGRRPSTRRSWPTRWASRTTR